MLKKPHTMIIRYRNPATLVVFLIEFFSFVPFLVLMYDALISGLDASRY